MNNNPIKFAVGGILLLIVLVLAFTSVKIVTIEGNELGVKETWSQGVVTNILQPKTYFLFPGWSQTIIKYDASLQKFVMNDKGEKEGEKSEGRAKDSYKVQSAEGQDMVISMNLQWRLDPSDLVQLHKTVRRDIEEKIVRPALMRVVKDAATTRKAIDAYSGEGLVKLQADIQRTLSQRKSDSTTEPTLAERGIIVGNFVIEHIELDPKYIEEIKGKQIATQQTLRAAEEQKAAEAKALVAKSLAQADLNTQVVAGERDAQLVVIRAKAAAEQVTVNATAQASQVTIAAKAAAEQVIVAAEAAKKQSEMAGEGKKLGMTAEAEGILAVGKAEAQAKQLMIDSYKAAGPDAYAKIQIAQSLAEGTKGIQGYLPNNFNPTIISGNFMDSIQAILAGRAAVSK
jgi:regulator of protease activity HflC (stomatin/prohibitin superfamily)